MGVFVDERGRPVVVGPNTIYIRTEFTVRQQMILQGLHGAIRQGDPDAGEKLLALLIAGWDGPVFENTPCTPENIARLNTNDPLVQAVLSAYQEMVAMADPKSSEPATSGGGRHSGPAT